MTIPVSTPEIRFRESGTGPGISLFPQASAAGLGPGLSLILTVDLNSLVSFELRF